MVLASHPYRPHECESVLFLTTQKANFGVMRTAKPGKRDQEMQAKLSEGVKVIPILFTLKSEVWSPMWKKPSSVHT